MPRSSWRLSTRPSPSSMDRDEVVATFAPAARAALAAFPVDPDGLELVTLAENVTWRVTDRRDGASWALKLHRPWYHTLEELISERLWVRALADAGIAVPLPLRTCSGEEFAFRRRAGERRAATRRNDALDGGPDHGRCDARGRRPVDRRSVVRAVGSPRCPHARAGQPLAAARRLQRAPRSMPRASWAARRIGALSGSILRSLPANGSWSSTRVGVSPKCCKG